MLKCPHCSRNISYGMTKVEMLNEVLLAVGYTDGKSKYSDGNTTKDEVVAIYNYLVETGAIKGK